MTQNDDRQKLVDLLTTCRSRCSRRTAAPGVRSVPMARQEVEPDAEMWFIASRDTRHVADIQAEPRVSLTFSSRDSWVALTGRAEVVEDRAKLEELWNTFAEAWLPGGPDNPDAVLLARGRGARRSTGTPRAARSPR